MRLPGRLLSQLVTGPAARARSLWRGLTGRSDVESEMREEFRHHIEMRTEALIREGHSPKEAERQAHLEFGHMETHRESARSSRGLHFFDQIRFSWLDVKLGLRMLRKQPGLTLAAVFALAVGIPVSMAPMHASRALEAPIPEDPDDRIRAIRYWNAETGMPASPRHYELDRWRESLGSFTSIGAAREVDLNLATGDGGLVTVEGTEVTASTFRILGTAPLMGRTLDRGDEAVGAPDVVVVGYDLWQARLGGDPGVVGTTLRLGDVPHTVVGVMPEGFFFPDVQDLWLPLREESASEPGEGLGMLVFGRLTDGVTGEEADAEVATFGQRMAAEFPETHGRLRAEVVPFGIAQVGLPRSGITGLSAFYLTQAACLVMLLIACANVAMLIFAGTATRLRELGIRTSLGATRARIVSQMFAESLVLSVSAAGLGLLLFQWLIARSRSFAIRSDLLELPPYWVDLSVKPETVAWALAWAVLSAGIAGVFPALKVTGRRVQQSIQKAAAGRSGMRFGGVTSALIVADVAIAVAAVGFAVGLFNQVRAATGAEDRAGYPAEEYLAVNLMIASEEPITDAWYFGAGGFSPRVATTQRALVQRLEAEPGVRAVAVADRLPRSDHEPRRIEVEGMAPAGSSVTGGGSAAGSSRGEGAPYVQTARVAPGFFDALDQPVLMGRGFDEADLEDDVAVVIVNTSFVDRVLDGRNPLGRRVRFPPSSFQPAERWYEIVGVVPRLGMDVISPHQDEGLYFPAAPGEIHPLRLAIRTDGPPQTFIPRLRQLVSEVDPDAVVREPKTADRVFQGSWYLYVLGTVLLAIVLVILVALAASGIYAIMSFAVSERTREIGIRTALGARKGGLAFRIARRSLTQIGLGALLGMPIAVWLYQLVEQGTGAQAASLGVALATGLGVVLLIGSLSCLHPTIRALRIEPTEALRGVE